MKNPVLDEIKKSACATLTKRYGYCGLLEASNFALLNSGGEKENLLVTIQENSGLEPLKHPETILRLALEESVKLQSHYATLLNQWDGGTRRPFKDADEWIARIQETKKD